MLPRRSAASVEFCALWVLLVFCLFLALLWRLLFFHVTFFLSFFSFLFLISNICSCQYLLFVSCFTLVAGFLLSCLKFGFLLVTASPALLVFICCLVPSPGSSFLCESSSYTGFLLCFMSLMIACLNRYINCTHLLNCFVGLHWEMDLFTCTVHLTDNLAT